MNTLYDNQPREKLASLGVAALSTTGLLQVIIGSGTAQASVYKIAKKVAKVLEKKGSTVTPNELILVRGVGTVKAGQIVALFELATRYPVFSKGEMYTNGRSLESLYADIRTLPLQTLLYVTFDGAGRVLSKRHLTVQSDATVARQVRKVFADCLSDSAVSILLAIGWVQQALEPSLVELNYVRDAYKTAELLGIPIRSFALVSSAGVHVIREGGL